MVVFAVLEVHIDYSSERWTGICKVFERDQKYHLWKISDTIDVGHVGIAKGYRRENTVGEI